MIFKSRLMKKYTLLLFIETITFVSGGFAQSDSFDIYKYLPPEFFTKSELPSRIEFTMMNNDTSFCTIILYKSKSLKSDALHDITSQWNERVVKRLSKANKKPAKIFTEQMWEGWSSTLAIGNFYQNKKKCVVMLNTFRKDKTTACVVYAFSDKLFNTVIEKFSTNIHLTQSF